MKEITKDQAIAVAAEFGIPVNSTTLPMIASYLLAMNGGLPSLFGRAMDHKEIELKVAKELFGMNHENTFAIIMDLSLLHLLHLGLFNPGIENEKIVEDYEVELASHIKRGMAVFSEVLLDTLPPGGNA